MGAVYEAVDERLDTIVALKETLFTDEKLRKQFEREARLLARLHHPALPRVSDHFTEDEGQFLVMQYIAGEDLAEMLQAHKAAFPPEQVLRWADQLCDALDYLHTQDPQVIHRDIKPQNLKLTARGQIVLLDFGLAKGSAGQMSVVTSSASIFGYTPNYAPLEQVQGLGTDARSDIYSLAATLYHLMTNVKPPDALSRAAAIVNGQIDPLSPANRVAPRVSPSVASVLSKGMSQNRAERYASAEEMRETLRAAASDQLNKAVPVGGTDASAKTVSLEARTRLVGASTQVEAGEAQTLVARDTTNVQTKALESERAKVVPTRSSRAWLAAVVLLVLIGGGSAAFFAYRAHKNAAKNNAGSVNPTESPKAEAQTATTQVNSVRVEPKASPQSTAEKTARPETSSQRANASKSAARRASDQTNITREATEAAEKAIHETERSGERGRDQSVRRPPDTPRYDPFRNQPGHPPGTGQIPEVRTLPNGTKVIRQPDGTRIVIMPNGSTRVYPPINRRQKRNP